MSDREIACGNLSWTPTIGQLIDLALAEDLGHGDVTTEIMGEGGPATGNLFCREPIVACGLLVAEWVVERAEPEIRLEPRANEGAALSSGDDLIRFHGPADAILRVERTVLNFLMRMCGVASHTARYVERVAGTGARIVDTRKTLPGWRILDKYAVRVGGGANHRMDLGSGVLIKDNHIAASGSVEVAVLRARAQAPHPLRVEVEVENMDGVEEALNAGAEIMLLDNMSPELVSQVVERVDGQVLLEVSGGVNLETVRDFAEAGADLISVGALTHSAPAVDLSLDLVT